MTYRICFVCTGNICRSPMAEAVMRGLLEAQGLDGQVEVDSAGTTSWHVGAPADRRALAALHAAGYDGSTHRARAFERSWLADRDLANLKLGERHDHFEVRWEHGQDRRTRRH